MSVYTLLRASILDFRPRLGNRCKLFPVNTLFRASILDFRPRLGNRCKLFPVNTLFRASILDFKARPANRCMVLPVYALLRASILDFRPRLANRCNTIVVAVENGPPAMAFAATTFRVRFYSSSPQRGPRPILFFVAAKENSFACSSRSGGDLPHSNN